MLLCRKIDIESFLHGAQRFGLPATAADGQSLGGDTFPQDGADLTALLALHSVVESDTLMAVGIRYSARGVNDGRIQR